MASFKSCLVIMPIGSGDAYQTYLNRYEAIIRPSIETFTLGGERVYDAVRADFMSKTGSITKVVLRTIYTADLVIADLTDLNPNVFYELGVRHSLRTGTILIALEGTTVPFDIGDLRVVFYRDRVGGEKEAIPAIQRLMAGIHEASVIDDSPIFELLPELHQPDTRELAEVRAQAAGLAAEAAELRGKLAVAEAANLSLRDSFATFERTVNSVLGRLTPSEREAAEEAVEDAARSLSSEARRQVGTVAPGDEDPSLVLVLMPLRDELSALYEMVRGAGQELGLTVNRADAAYAPGRITDQIADAVSRAGLIIADVTGQNADVLFEIGIAMSLRKRIILLAETGERLPFDIAHLPVIFYENSSVGAFELRRLLVETMRNTRE